jgi:hypothetical protein
LFHHFSHCDVFFPIEHKDGIPLEDRYDLLDGEFMRQMDMEGDAMDAIVHGISVNFHIPFSLTVID